MTILIQAEELLGILCDTPQGLGSDATEAMVVAEHLVNANLRGHDSHGAYIVDYYKNCLDNNALQANAALTPLKDNGSVLLFEGNRGYGQRLAREAVFEGSVRAKQQGVAIVGLRNAHHTGRAGTYCEQAAAEGLISLVFINALEFPPRVVPLGGKEPKLMTNPIAFGMPRNGQAPLVMDFATSAIAFGKAEVARNRGIELPPGCIIDGEGRPSTDPNDLYTDPAGNKKPGAILPFGAHKGYGLLLFCELLAGALTGGETARAITEHTQGCTNNFLSILINPDHLGGSTFASEMQQYLSFITNTEPANPDSPVMLPGDLELRTLAQRSEAGIPLDDKSWAGIVAVARSVGVEISD